MTRARAAELALIGALALLGAYHLALTLSTVLSYGLVHPLADEFRLSHRYLTMPFPDSILALENGHRPVIPGLLRWIGLVHMGGSQAVQTAASAFSAVISVLVILREARRGLRGHAMFQAAAACLVASLMLWNANDRMFVHSNESAHVFIVTLFVVAAVVAAIAAAESRRTGLWAVAVACSVLATMSFGTGLACFGAIFVVALLHRARVLVLAAIGAAAAITLAVYLYALPGADGVRNVVGTTTFSAAVLFSAMRLGAALAELANAKAFAGIIGGIACVVLVAAVAFRFARGARFTRLQVFSLALLAFGVGANLLIVGSRAAYFFVYPDQVFADRYLYWSCMLWMAVGLFALASLREGSPRAQRTAVVAILAFAGIALAPAITANALARERYEEVETAAAAFRLGVQVDAATEPVSDGGAAVAYRLVDELGRRRMGDFRAAEGLRLGAHVAVSRGTLPRVHAQSSGPLDARPVPVRRVSIALPRDVASAVGDAFWVADGDGRIVGALSKAGQARYPRNAARLGVPRFDVLLGWIAAPAHGPLLLLEPAAGGKYRGVAALEP